MIQVKCNAVIYLFITLTNISISYEKTNSLKLSFKQAYNFPNYTK